MARVPWHLESPPLASLVHAGPLIIAGTQQFNKTPLGGMHPCLFPERTGCSLCEFLARRQ